ncbi:MAG TPA: tRNA lysidine(34) synthetase TilS [Pyrinomonadaceae bacterium]
MPGETRTDSLSPFARRLLAEWRRLELPLTAARVVVAVSGGADSTALLLACDELSRARRLAVTLTVAHFEHGLRGAASRADAEWVAALARARGYEYVCGCAAVGALSEATRDNLEQAARRARYEFLARAAAAAGARTLLTAHTADDQAETVLLALARGSGADGLAGMRAVRPLLEQMGAAEGVNDGACVLLARPLLRWARRADTEDYCRAAGVVPRVDAHNEDERFARVRVRRRLVPLFETLNPRAVAALARAAELLRADNAALEAAAARLLVAADARPPGAAEEAARAGPLRVAVLSAAEPAVRRRALRRWLRAGRGDLRRLTLAHVEGVERLLAGTQGGRVAELPGGARVERRRGLLVFHPTVAGRNG